MMSGSEAAVRFPHRWTPGGVVSSDAPCDQIAQLLEVVDRVAEIPQAMRAGADVRRIS
jgi:hypothetical protein